MAEEDIVDNEIPPAVNGTKQVDEASSEPSQTWSLALNLITCDAFAFTLLALMMISTYFYCDPHHRGFWCSDESIRMPLKPLTVTLSTILIFSCAIPCSVIIFTESKLGLDYRIWLKRFFFSGGINLMLTIFCKFTTGRLRPHFIAVCDPDIDCVSNANMNSFISDYECRNPIAKAIKQARQSFFSGHASISLQAAVFLVLYIHHRYAKSTGLVKALIQFVILLAGIYPGITQVNNYWHHWSDVLVGYIVGTLIAVINFNFVIVE